MVTCLPEGRFIIRFTNASKFSIEENDFFVTSERSYGHHSCVTHLCNIPLLSFTCRAGANAILKVFFITHINKHG